MTLELPYEVLAGTPEPIRRRWQPLRAGILNLFRYDAQTFAFHNGRLLLRGNNGSGKSMAVEVLIPYVLDADLSPQRLSTFGGRDRGMFLWLLGFEKPPTRANARAYVWVEFGRRRPDGGADYLTAGACLEGLRSDTSVKAHYWTTAARVGVQLHLGGPGTEPLTRQALAAALAEQTAAGLPGQVHPDARSHRRAVNEALYGLHERRFDALRATLLQLRRPKLSDKLNEESLNLILRNSLAPISTTIVQDLAEGFERLDRHAAAVGELRGVVDDLRSLQASYRRYARVAGAARADAVVASERAIRTARERASEAQAQLDGASRERDRIDARRVEIKQRRGEIRGREEALREREEYREGRNLEPLRELVRSLGGEADRLEGEATDLRRVAERDSRSSQLASRAADDAGETAADLRFDAEAAAVAAAVDALHRRLATDVDEVRGRDVDTEEALHAAVTEVRALVPAVVERSRAWSGTVTALQRLQRTAREDDGRLQAARTETARAEGEANEAEEVLNAALEADRDATLAWVDALTRWTDASPQLRAGQAPPLPWDPAAALDHAPRWARESHDARAGQLAAERAALDAAASRWETAAESWTAAARELAELAALTATAGKTTRDHRRVAAAYRTDLEVWAGDLRELPLGAPPPDWAGVPTPELPTTSLDWIDRAATVRGAALAADAARLELQIAAARTHVTDLEEKRNRLATPGLPDLPAPATRGATRDGRRGAPFYLLVDFAPDVCDADRRGIEAAAIDAGLADAWVAPDGRLLAGPDGGPLLDTQLAAVDGGDPAGAAALAELLVPDAACASAGVPADVVAALLDRIAVADTARHHSHGLVIGRDGTWRSGPLAGAHAVAAVTLIGAANREADRLVRLAEAERDLADAQVAEAMLIDVLARCGTATDRLRAEREALPSAAAMRTAAEAARRATDAVRAGRRTTEQRVTEAYRSAAGEAVPPDDVTTAGREVHAGWNAVTAAMAEDPAHPDAPEWLAALRDGAEVTAQSWRRAVTTLQDRSETIARAADAARRERDALPTDEPVRRARAVLDAARRALDGARTRLDGRREEERTALEHATGSNAALTAALLVEKLPADTDPERLDAALTRYRGQAAQWLNAEAEAVRGAGAAGLAAARSLDSADRAATAARSAVDKRDEHRTQRIKLESLSDAYGLAFGEIVRALDRLSAEDTGLATELDGLQRAEIACENAHVSAEAALRDADRMRKEADEARTTAGTAFLAAARVGVLTAAGLPDAPAGAGDGPPDRTEDEEPGATTGGLGVRALRDWATAVREAIGDTVRTVQAVEQAANRVTDTRHGLEPRLAGRVIVRDEQREQMLLLHVNRASRTYPLHEMIDTLGEELARDSDLLAREEAELFRKFLTGETRREVTTKVRDARTTIRAMTELMAAHPTGSGIQVRLRWVPDDKNAPGMQDVVTLMAKDAPLESEKERLQAFFRQRIDRVRTGVDADWTAQLTELLDYRQWWRFQLEYRRSRDDGWTALNSKTHGALSGGEKAVCLHLPLFAAAATYCDSASVRAVDVEGRDVPGCPRLIVLDEVFAGVDEDNRGELFDIVRTLDLDMVATSESEQGFYPQLDGVAVYHLVSSDALGCVLATRTVWDGSVAHQLLDGDLVDAP